MEKNSLLNCQKKCKTENNQSVPDNAQEWSRDWSNFNLKEVGTKLDKAEMQSKQKGIPLSTIDIGITQ